MTRVMPLSDLFHIGSSKRVLKSQWVTEGVPFYRGREVTRLSVDGFVANELFISEKHYAELAAQYGAPKTGDIIITAIGTIGNSYIVRDDDRFYFKDASVLWMRRTSDVSSEFVNLWLKSPQFLGQLESGNGATVDTLTIQKLQSVRIEVPVVSEQHRIVALLDEAFAGIAIAKANAEKNLVAARAVFAAQLSAVVAEALSRNGSVALSELAADITDGDHMPPPKSARGVPFITIGNINKESRKIDFSDTFRVPQSYWDGLKANRKPKKGDVLYTVTGSFGIPVLVNEESPFCFQRHIGLIRPKAHVHSPWLQYVLMSPQLLRQAEDGATGTAQKTVSLKTLRGLRVPQLPEAEQEKAADGLCCLEAETRALEAIYTSKLAALDELKQSLLHQAFSGQL